jgi:hypothetical protein
MISTGLIISPTTLPFMGTTCLWTRHLFWAKDVFTSNTSDAAYRTCPYIQFDTLLEVCIHTFGTYFACTGLVYYLFPFSIPAFSGKPSSTKQHSRIITGRNCSLSKRRRGGGKTCLALFQNLIYL